MKSNHPSLHETQGGSGRRTLAPAERVVLAVEAVERGVNNGGFDGLFRNSSKEYAPDCVSALRAIGRPEVADLAQRALDALGLRQELSVEAIDLEMERDDEARDETLAQLDAQYYEIAGDLAPNVLHFIEANRQAIILGS